LVKTVLAELGVTGGGHQAAASTFSSIGLAFTSEKVRPLPSRNRLETFFGLQTLHSGIYAGRDDVYRADAATIGLDRHDVRTALPLCAASVTARPQSIPSSST
jgi:hypothetical protein